jgi:hypothetical protein
MSITLITPTGDRPEAFNLCLKWMSRQTLFPDQWLIVDDGEIPLLEEDYAFPSFLNKTIIRRNPSKEEGFTLTANLKKALPHIEGDIILIIEDDDWYGNNYIKTMCEMLSSHDLVGEGHARYYYVPIMKYRRIQNIRHASLCQTGFTKKILPLFEKCLDGDSYVDTRLWNCNVSKHLFMDEDDRLQLNCSMKGLKGRKGIGVGHNLESPHYTLDTELKYLIKWIGKENAQIYMDHVGQSFESSLLLGTNRKRKFFNKKPPIVASSPKEIKVAKPIVQLPIKTPHVKRKPIESTFKEKSITVITLTGDRPVSFDLLRKWMENQTVKPNQWIVVDDGKEPIKNRREYEYIRREPTPQDYVHTMCLNLAVALERVTGDKIIIMEDDDWYSSIYIEYMNKLLDNADLVGFKNLLFYYPSLSMYMEKSAAKQPAFSQTAFHSNIIPIVKRICTEASKDYDLCGKGLVDKKLWNDPLNISKSVERVILTTSLKTTKGVVLSKGTVFDPPIPMGIIRRAHRKQGAEFCNGLIPIVATKSTVVCDKYLTVGMKGMPGRKGLTTAQDASNKKYKKDPDYNLLKSIIKKDIDFYLELFA